MATLSTASFEDKSLSEGDIEGGYWAGGELEGGG